MTIVETPAEQHEPLDHPTNTNVVLVGQGLCILVPFVIWFMPLDVDPTIKHVLAIVGFMIIAWITQAVDYVLAGFIGCFLFWALGSSSLRLHFPVSPTTPPGFSSGHS